MVNYIYIDGSGHKVSRPVITREEYIKVCNSAANCDNWRRYRATGEERYKRGLVQMCYNCQLADGAQLKGVQTVSPFFFYDIDCGDREECHRIMRELVSRKEELGLVEVAESAGYGVHAIGRREAGKTILECQVKLSMLTHTEMDTNTKDCNRVVFHGPIDDETTPLLDDALFTEALSEEEAAEEYQRLKEREAQGLEEVPAEAKKANKHYRPWQDEEKREEEKREKLASHPDGMGDVAAMQCCSSKETNPLVVSDSEARYNGLLFKDIIAKYWELFNDGKEPVEGDRNVLTFELAMTLRSICGYSLEKMMAVIPNYWKTHPQPLPSGRGVAGAEKAEGQESLPLRGDLEGSEALPLTGERGEGLEGSSEWRQTLENALKEPRKGMPFRLKQVLQALKSTAGVKACGGTPTAPPPMPKKLPPLIRLLTKNVPQYYKPAVASTVFPALGAHLHGVTFRYWDNVDHEATFMNVLIGRQSIGKGSIKKPIEFIMEDIRLRDIPNRQREAEWKQKNPGAKQKKDPRPTDICIQMLIDNLTDAVFNQRIVDANNNGQRYIYTIVDEIEALKKVTSRGTVDEVGLLIRKAFDNSLAGQERVGADSVSGIAPLRWNFNASTTPPNARKFLYKMVNDGTVSRLDLATIILNDSDNDTPPVLGIYDEAFAQELKPYIERLEAASGLIECPQAKRLSIEMRKENADIVRLYDSEAYRVLSYRANVIAWLKGMVLYVAHGYKWDKTMADFVRWSQQYNLWCKMLYFGKQLEKELREEDEIQQQAGPQNLLNQLPDEFTREEYLQMRNRQGRSGDGESTLRVWKTRGYIAFDELTCRYCKTAEYLRKFGAPCNPPAGDNG